MHTFSNCARTCMCTCVSYNLGLSMGKCKGVVCQEMGRSRVCISEWAIPFKWYVKIQGHRVQNHALYIHVATPFHFTNRKHNYIILLHYFSLSAFTFTANTPLVNGNSIMLTFEPTEGIISATCFIPTQLPQDCMWSSVHVHLEMRAPQ